MSYCQMLTGRQKGLDGGLPIHFQRLVFCREFFAEIAPDSFKVRLSTPSDHFQPHPIDLNSTRSARFPSTHHFVNRDPVDVQTKST